MILKWDVNEKGCFLEGVEYTPEQINQLKKLAGKEKQEMTISMIGQHIAQLENYFKNKKIMEKKEQEEEYDYDHMNASISSL